MSEPTLAAATTLDRLLAPYAGRGREALLPVLWAVQTAEGYIGPDAVKAISQMLRVPEADIFGVIGFYSMFYDKPTGETIIRVCTSPTCAALGGHELVEELCEKLGIAPGETTADGRYTIEHAPCLGLCEHAPAALISQRGAGESQHAPATDADALLTGQAKTYPAVTASGPDVLLAGVDAHAAQPLAAYGDYTALRRALHDLTPEQVIDEVKASGLIGRGGAAFPTGLKLQFTRGAAGEPKYIVCNADESEPGTFKDRVLMERRPHLILEGMALCGYAIGASQGYLFVRGEYPNAAAIVQAAIDEAEAAGMHGEDIMGSGFSFSVEVRRGAGAYICGEETSLFEAIEGKRGFPRIKPPFPTTHGLFGKPTAINNVETLASVPAIITRGGAWFKSLGTEKSTGVKLVSVSGHVNRPGVYEIVPGITLRECLDSYCGGVQGELQTVLMGGAAGTFLAPDQIDVPLTFEGLWDIGSTLGSGAIMVFNTTIDLRDILRSLGEFFAHESCGKCYPCQLGSMRQHEILNRLDAPLPGDRTRLEDIGKTMTEASLCGLGQTAASAVLSAIKQWPELFS
ncbi:MAG: NAD(P)H-dependent oxidoreductase subunit E [Anaerolineae bacterium]|nr:NAD(P)H-dependent oxidoreductase subunit E [Anaerolineae bacterium]